MSRIKSTTSHCATETTAPIDTPPTATPRTATPARSTRTAIPQDRFESTGSQSRQHASVQRAMARPASPTSSAPTHESLVRQAIAGGGNLAELPALPPVPTRTGAEIVEATGMRAAFVSREEADRAIRDAAQNGHDGLIHTLVLSGGHTAADLGAMGIDRAAENGSHIAEAIETRAGGLLLETAGLALVTYELADSMHHELHNLAEGRQTPSPAVINGLEREVEVRQHRADAALMRHAETNFNAGREAAIHGRAMDPRREHLPDYDLGYAEGRNYRSENRALIDRHSARNSALAEARQYMQRTGLSPNPTADVQPLRFRSGPETVGVEIGPLE